MVAPCGGIPSARYCTFLAALYHKSLPPARWDTLMDSSPRITRRGFLAGAACGLAAGAPLAWLAARRFPAFNARSTEDKQPEYAMPGPFKGRVIRVHNPGAVRPK